MINPVEISDQEYARLQKAKETRKYGHLETWKELYLFMRMIATRDQVREIKAWAARRLAGEKIQLPLWRMAQTKPMEIK